MYTETQRGLACPLTRHAQPLGTFWFWKVAACTLVDTLLGQSARVGCCFSAGLFFCQHVDALVNRTLGRSYISVGLSHYELRYACVHLRCCASYTPRACVVSFLTFDYLFAARSQCRPESVACCCFL